MEMNLNISMEKYEYKIVDNNPDGIYSDLAHNVHKLDELGESGWQLVAILVDKEIDYIDYIRFYFKRKIEISE